MSTLMPMSARFLLVSRVGPDHMLAGLLQRSSDRQFDLLLSAYSPDVTPPTSEPGLVFEYMPGTKVAGYSDILERHHDLISGYDYVALFDDDIVATVETCNEMFALCKEYNTKIAQPALSPESHFTYAGLLQQPSFKLRFVNFIEMMCPVFRSDVLQELRPIFSLGYESGIDLIWCNLVAGGNHDFAVFDSCCVHHTRPIGSRKTLNGFGEDEDYEDQIGAILSAFELPWFPCRPYLAIARNGNKTSSRIRLFLSALQLLSVIPLQEPKRERLEYVLVHLKHLMFAKTENRNIPQDVRNRILPENPT